MPVSTPLYEGTADGWLIWASSRLGQRKPELDYSSEGTAGQRRE